MPKTKERPTYKQLQEALGLRQSHAWKLANGKMKPSLGLAARIERELGYPASAWAEAA